MKKFLVFAGDNYYPDGGWCDLKGDFESIDKAKSFCQEIAPDNDWIQIVDIHSATFLYWGQMNDVALAKYYPNFQRLEIKDDQWLTRLTFQVFMATNDRTIALYSSLLNNR